MKGQFYLLSVVLLSAIVTTVLISVVSEPRAEEVVTSNGFLVYTLERAAEDAVRAAVVDASNTGDASKINSTILNFTRESQDFARGMRASVSWEYAIENSSESNATVNYTMRVQNGRTTVTDSFTARSALEARAAARYSTSLQRTYLNVTVYNENGNDMALANPNFEVFLNDTLTNFNIVHISGGLYAGQRAGSLGSGTYNISARVTDSRQIIAKNSTFFIVP